MEMIDVLDRHPATVLLDETDPFRRARAHFALGQRAMARNDVDTAMSHLRRAADLDPTDERPKELLHRIQPRQHGRATGWRRLFGR